ncbi:hypothetical protein DPSP01_009980 [Paraphaeosphaeria sporulosa]
MLVNGVLQQVGSTSRTLRLFCRRESLRVQNNVHESNYRDVLAVMISKQYHLESMRYTDAFLPCRIMSFVLACVYLRVAAKSRKFSKEHSLGEGRRKEGLEHVSRHRLMLL